MKPVDTSANGSSAGITGLEACLNAKKKHVNTIYSHSASYKKLKMPVTGGVIDSSASSLSLEDISVVVISMKMVLTGV
ncbi:hypothetical protein G9A89_023444 [Geosiphon pyriformis]|nr:hypothetical protein G9A89_023444 [Geosiphon pyriformis]